MTGWSGFTPQVVEFAADDHLRSLTVELIGNAPAQLTSAHAVYRDQVYRLSRKENQLLLGASDGTVVAFLHPSHWKNDDYAYGPWMGNSQKDSEELEQLFDTAVRPLIAHDLGVQSDEIKQRVALSDDRVRIYLYSEMPEEMFATVEYADGSGALASKREGRVLYAFDVFRPE